MKMTKKKVLVLAIAICLIAIISVSTLAWFQASEEVTNYFQVTTDGDQKPDFKLELFEHELNGTELDMDTEVDQNTYEHIAPGDELPKDPTLRNNGQYDQWVRVKITLTNYAAWELALGDGYEFDEILAAVNPDWVLDETTLGTDTLVYYKSTKLLPGEESQVFSAVKIPEAFTVDNMPVAFQLNIVGEAIQAANTGDTAVEAFANWQ